MPDPGRGLAWARGWFWLGLAAVLALMAAPIGPDFPTTGSDKSDHVLAFLVLGTLGLRAYPARRPWVVAGLVAFGLLTEGIQAALPYRAAEWRDIVANATGVALACLLHVAWRRFRSRPAAG